jgi:hypothetical protein
VSTQCYASVPSVVSFAQSVGATLIGDPAGDGEIGDHGPLLLMVISCLTGYETARRRDVSPSRQPTNPRVVCR